MILHTAATYHLCWTCLHTRAHTHVHAHTQRQWSYTIKQTVIASTQQMKQKAWTWKQENVLVTLPKWLSSTVTKNQGQSGKKKKKTWTRINSKSQMLTPQHKWQLVSKGWLNCLPELKVITLRRIKLEEKDIFPASRVVKTALARSHQQLL